MCPSCKEGPSVLLLTSPPSIEPLPSPLLRRPPLGLVSRSRNRVSRALPHPKRLRALATCGRDRPEPCGVAPGRTPSPEIEKAGKAWGTSISGRRSGRDPMLAADVAQNRVLLYLLLSSGAGQGISRTIEIGMISAINFIYLDLLLHHSRTHLLRLEQGKTDKNGYRR